MNHSQAIEGQCTERYLLGDMDEHERSAFEEHFFDCRDCADDVKTAVAFVANARAVFRESDEAEVQEPGAQEPEVLPFQPRRFGQIPALLAAAMVLIVCGAAYQALFVVPGLQRQLAEAQAPKAVGWQFLSISRAAPPVIKASSSEPWIGLRLSQSTGQSFPYYRYELRNADRVTVQSTVIQSPPAGDELGLVIPATELPTGAYVVVLSGLESPEGPPVAPEIAKYPFTLERID